jgi:hypothetical protein
MKYQCFPAMPKPGGTLTCAGPIKYQTGTITKKIRENSRYEYRYAVQPREGYA